MDISVSDAAKMMGVSAVRARRLAHDGRVRARQVGGQWLIDPSSLPSVPRRSRPMSPRIAWALIYISDSRPVDWIDPSEAYRLRKRLDRLVDDPEPELVLRSWLASRGDRLLLAAAEPEGLRSDPRVVLSGISDLRSGMSAGGQVEGYVSADEAQAVRRDHLLVGAGADSNVVLHIAPVDLAGSVPCLLLAADLADHDGPRESARARELIGRWSQSHQCGVA